MTTISSFIETHYRHFNAAALLDAARAYREHIASGQKMMVTLAGAMSTAELGISLAQMIRQGKIHAITCTGANLEEDIFNLVAHDYYERVPGYRDLSPAEEKALYDRGMNRVTDTCIPEEQAMERVRDAVIAEWKKADGKETNPPHVYLWRCLDNPEFQKLYQIDPAHSWMIAAKEHNIPIFTPGWEDSTLGNMFAALTALGEISTVRVVESGIETMHRLINWYLEATVDVSMGFFQIGGGIAGDFPICVVPLIHQDMEKPARLWGYFCQISDSTTSYGSYSGAVPNEKITWGKLGIDTPKFIIESDATIVAPLMFAYILGQ